MKARTLIFSLASILLLALSTCKKDPQPIMERFDLSREDLTIGTTSASIVGTYAYPGAIDEITVCVSEDGVHPAMFAADINGKNFAVEMTGLRPATSYQYYYSVDYGFTKPFTTEAKTFTTLSESPTVRTIDVMSIDSTTVRVNCETVSDGGVEITERGVCWNTYGNPNLDDECLTYASAGLGQYSCRISGLALSTKYYVRAYAKNSLSIGFGEVLEFQIGDGTLLPEVATVEVREITATTAMCLGNVASEGGSELIERGVCWGVSINPSLTANHLAAPETTLGMFEVVMSDLMPNKTYHVRAYAINSNGTAYGNDLTFTTTVGLPVVTTDSVLEITSTTAHCWGNVIEQGASNVTERGICWSAIHNPTTNDSHNSCGTGVGSFSCLINDLAPNTTYYVRAYAKNNQGTSYGTEVSFVAVDGLPSVITSNVTSITNTTAQCGGNVTDQGASMVTERGVCWSRSHSPTISNSHINNGMGLGSFTCTITGLTECTKYYVRAYAKNSHGIIYGNEKEFVTTADLPVVTTTEVTNITQTTATSGGTVVAEGNVTERGICWSTSQNPTINGSHASNGNGAGSFSVNITGLNPGTTYYVRAYANTSTATTYGNVVSFTTQQATTVPTVTTSQVTNVTHTSATGGGNVTNSGGATVTERGICWSTSHNPTTSGSHANSGTGTGSFTVNMTGLTANTTYYVRAYAINSAGTAYGSEVTFTTLSGGGGTVPTGAINGLFTINTNGDQVFFSQGNLQYIGTGQWKFADNQWDVIGDSQGNSSQSTIRDLFGWGTSGYNHGAIGYQPWCTINSHTYYYAYGYEYYNLYDQSGQADWGYNAIVNGGNNTNIWRTLTKEEWGYIFDGRITVSGIRFAKAKLSNMAGVILFPDSWSSNIYSINSPNNGDVDYSNNVITSSQWVVLEENGAVFLPAAGYRQSTNVSEVGVYGTYWSSSYINTVSAGYLLFDSDYLNPQNGSYGRNYGRSVRLVQDYQP